MKGDYFIWSKKILKRLEEKDSEGQIFGKNHKIREFVEPLIKFAYDEEMRIEKAFEEDRIQKELDFIEWKKNHS